VPKQKATAPFRIALLAESISLSAAQNLFSVLCLVREALGATYANFVDAILTAILSFVASTAGW
jgi:hypothetical protein